MYIKMKKLNIKIDLNNLAFNFEKIKQHIDNVIPIVKANAYNIGAYSVVKKLLSIKNPQKDYFVFSLEEGIELKKFFPELRNIFILGGIYKNDEKYFKKYNLIPVINSFEQLQIANNSKIKDIALKFNSGINRSGFNINEVEKVKKYINENNINILIVLAHFSCADDKSNKNNIVEINNFKKVISYFPEKNILKSLQASDGILNFDLHDICNSCRPGLALYGYYNNFKPVCSITSYIDFDGINFFLPVGINNGFTTQYGNENNYILYNGVKIFIKSIDENKIILDTNDKNLINKTVIILGNSITYKDFENMCGTDIRDIIARLIANVDIDSKNFEINTERLKTDIDYSNYKAKIITKNNNIEAFYSTILEKRIVENDGIAGYSGTEKVKKGDTLATFFGGYADGISRSISNKKCTVFVENKNKKLIECEIFAKVSMDQTIIKIPKNEFDNINIGSKVVVFDKEHPVERFEKATSISKKELFFMCDKSKRIKQN